MRKIGGINRKMSTETLARVVSEMLYLASVRASHARYLLACVPGKLQDAAAITASVAKMTDDLTL